MLIDDQREEIAEFCRKHEIIRFWMMDEPLLNAAVNAGRPSIIVTFRPYWVAAPEKLARMERDLAAITGPETAIYSTDGLSPRLTEKILKQATPIFPDPAAPPATHEAVAQFCQKHHIAKLWLLDAPLPDAHEKEFSPSVIVNFHPGYPGGFEFFRIERGLRALFGPGATLYKEERLREETKTETLKMAEVCYADPA